MKKRISDALDLLHQKMDDWSDYLLPAAVNEAKQMVNSKIFSSIFLLGIVFFLFVALYLFLVPTDESSGPYGFLFFSGIMDVGLILLIPSMLYQNMTNERSNGSFELMAITSISPLKVVIGKWQTGLMQSIVFGSIVVPGLIFSYFFRGVPISLIFVSLFLTLFASQFAILAAIFFCSLGNIRASRIFLQFIGSGVYLIIMILTINIKQEMVRDDAILNGIFSLEFGKALLFIVPFVITLEGFLVMISAGQLSSYAANKSTWPRILYSLLILEIGLLPFFIDYNYDAIDFFIFTIFAHCLTTYFFFLEKDQLSKKLYLNTINTKSFVKKIFYKFFYPGKSSAYLLFVIQSCFLWYSFYFYLRNANLTAWGSQQLISVCFGSILTYMSLIYLVLAVIHKFYLDAKITLMLFGSFFVTVIFFLVPVIFYYRFRLKSEFLVMNIFSHLNNHDAYKFHVALNLFITSLVLIITLIIANILNNRKVETYRNFIAGERG